MFEVDIKGILNVKGEDKGTSKTEIVTITIDMGHPSQEIDSMVQEAHARNNLERYV
jgi:molecular chaperone DnaK (HSP70)